MEPTMPDMGTARCAYEPVITAHPPGDLISPEDTAEILGVTIRTLNNMRHAGRGPARYKLAPRCVRYSRAEVFGWLAACREEPKAA